MCYVASVHEVPSEFARLLAEIKRDAGLSDQAIADAAGVDRSQAWRWANASARPGYEPVRRLAAWITAERPRIADLGAALLPAAGFGAPPAAPPAIAAPPSPAPDSAQVRAYLYAALDAANRPLAAQVLAEVAAARRQWPGPGTPPAAVLLADPVERAIWEFTDADDEEKAAEVAVYRARRAESRGGTAAAAG